MRTPLSIIIAKSRNPKNFATSAADAAKLIERNARSATVLRLAPYLGRASVLVSVAAQDLARLLPETDKRRGLICNGGPWNVQASWEFASQVRNVAVNPLLFPSTLVSSAATTAASVVGAHAFAFVAGYDSFAFFEVLRVASQALRQKLADEVLAVAVSAASSTTDLAAQRSGQPIPRDFAVGFALGTFPSKLKLLEVSDSQRRLDQYRNAILYHAALDAGVLTFATKAIHPGESLGSLGAQLIIAAYHHFLEFPPPSKTNGFVVTLCDAHRYAMAAFQVDK